MKRSSEARLCVLPPGRGGSNCWWKSRCCRCCCCCRTSPSAGSTTHSGVQIELLDSADDHRNNVSPLINRPEAEFAGRSSPTPSSVVRMDAHANSRICRQVWTEGRRQTTERGGVLAAVLFVTLTTQSCSGVSARYRIRCTHGVSSRLSLIQVM